MLPDNTSAIAEQPTEWTGLFSRVGSELRTLAGAVGDMQDFLAPLIEDVVARDPRAIERLQDLDVLEQSLQALSDLMVLLDKSAVLTDTDGLSCGMQAIRLSDLAKRLSPPRARPVEAPVAASTLELF